jgi:suppressor for copper-sensitivity B
MSAMMNAARCMLLGLLFSAPVLVAVAVSFGGSLAGSGHALAAASEWGESREARARIISSTNAVGDLGELRLGLEITLDPGWKTYWRTPGEGGLPPVLDWSASENVAIAEIDFPAPKRFQILGIDSIGYVERVVYPITIVPGRPGEAVVANLTLDYLTCSDICIPQHAELSLTLPGGAAGPNEHTFAIDQARGQIPAPGTPGFGLIAATVSQGEGDRWWLELETNAALATPDAFVEAADGSFAFGAPERVGPTRLRLPVHYAEASPATLDGGELTVTLTDGIRAFEETINSTLATAESVNLLAWVTILVTALVGGLILNLMPCVLPVLSIKIMGLMQHGGGDLGKARSSFLATAAGIVVSFMVLAGAAIALKAGGVAVGWGIQFQEPVFITFMTLICVLFAANLWGLFEIPMPAFIGRLGEGQAGSFTTGLFATLLATPCSAPFVGTAVAFALGRGAVETLAVFLAMGIGLALPYLCVAAWPKVATSLPKPGKWVVWVRWTMGILLGATGVWLASILHELAGDIAIMAVAILSVGLVLWLWRAKEGWRLPGAAAAIALALVVQGALPSTAPGGQRDIADALWQPFSHERLASLVADGKIVMVDVTADWCITCQANKAAVLHRGEVFKRLSSDVIALRADWTRPDPVIQAYLASFGRYGIPFNAVYGPGAPGGLSLPELLSEGMVLDAMEQASKAGS